MMGWLHCPLIAAENAMNAMFTVLTSHVTAGELVQQEDGNLTYSKLAVALGDTSLMSAMKSAREAEKGFIRGRS